MPPETALVAYDADLDNARRLLARCSNAPEAKRVADLARAAEVYARRQKLGEEAVGYATAVKVDALTLLGEFLKANPPVVGARGSPGPGRGKRSSKVELRFPSGSTLADHGIDKKESMEAQALAELKEKDPATHEQVRARKLSVRAATFKVRRHRAKKAKAKAARKARAAAKAALDDTRFRVGQADGLDRLRSQPPDSVDLVFTSPPYESARLYLEGGKDEKIARDTESWVAWLVEVFEAALRCCKGLVAFVVEGQTKRYRWSAGPALLMADLHRKGVHLRKPPVYHRVGIPGSGGPDWLRNDYEFVVCATRGGQLPWSDNVAMGKPPKFAPGGAFSHRQQDGSRVNAESGPAAQGDR